MKKIILTSMSLLLLLIFGSCAAQNATVGKLDSTSINFEYFYRGFATMHDDMADAYPRDALIIQTEEDWSDFMGKYIPGIYYRTSIDFSKECLIFSATFPARSIYADGVDIKSYTVKENKLEPEYIDYGPGIGMTNEIYAQNVDDIVHCFVNIVKINKSEIPKNIQNIYHKS